MGKHGVVFHNGLFIQLGVTVSTAYKAVICFVHGSLDSS
jgi:hypothetical protein